MKRIKFFLLVLLAQVIPTTALADEWQDPESGVCYTYDPNGTTAEVKGGNGYSGSPQAYGDIVLLQTITINGKSYSVTSIGKCAFIYSYITSVTIPNSITTIQDDSFNHCRNLQSVNIPKSVTSIGLCAFYGCYKLTEITIPESVSHIDVAVFGECGSLETINVDARNNYFDSRDDCNAIIETATNTLVVGCKSTIIPNSVTSIELYAFDGCTALTSITIPNSVTSIGNCAFSGCSSLTSITIPSGVTSIGDFAFSNCSSLVAVMVDIETPLAITANTFSNRANATLYVPKSCKATYEAADYWKEFKEIREIPNQDTIQDGDVNSDGEVDLSDAIMVTYYSLHEVPSNFNEAVADMNGDGEIDLSDAIIIIYKSLGVK